jgi:aryl-alcohol dehydrogenase-like predicted oxidoreductase
MKYRRLGESDLTVSVIGLGTLAMGGQAYGPVPAKDAIQTIRHGVDIGINLIDTSDNYGLGQAETIVGKALKGIRDKVVLATKGGTPWEEGSRVRTDCSAKAITQAIEDSLRRLDTDTIDLYQVHVPDPGTPFEETASALERARQAGKIRYVGVSNFWTDDMLAWLEVSTAVSDQMPYNFLQRDVEKNLLPLCQERDVGVIAYTPLLMGMFSGALSTLSRFEEGDHRAHYPQFHGEPFSQTLALIERLKAVAQEMGLTMAQLALAWDISCPGVTCAIPGARRPDQVEENAGAGDRALDQSQRERVNQILAEMRVATPRLMSAQVLEVRQGPRGKVATLDMGVKVAAPDSVRAGQQVYMDILTGQIAASKDEDSE